jgi:peptidoglycan/LPS O-acetylase OafA/YrhL
MDGQKRDAWLDALRGIAVLLVLGRHLDLAAPGAELPTALAIWQRGGWVGVDLFFVLSGFLVAGLLFREHQQRGSFNVLRFLVRRGLRIYPAFYVLVLVTWLAYRYFRVPRTSGAGLMAEVFFLQNYFSGMWSHTWSLAVEEHFYLALPIVLLGVGIFTRSRRDPFRMLLPLAVAVFVGVPILRCLQSLAVPYRHETHLFPTHLRADALMAGVLLAYVFHYHRAGLERWLVGRRGMLLAAGVAWMAPAFLFDIESAWLLSTLGLSLFALGAVWLIAAGLRGEDHAILGPLGLIGRRSYSIYLWHMPMLVWGLPLCEKGAGFSVDAGTRIAVYLAGSLGLGALMAWLIERPVSWLRDRWAPGKETPAVGVPAGFLLFSGRIRGYDNIHDQGSGGSQQSPEVVHDALAEIGPGGRNADRAVRPGDGEGFQGGHGHAEEAPAEGRCQ